MSTERLKVSTKMKQVGELMNELSIEKNAQQKLNFGRRHRETQGVWKAIQQMKAFGITKTKDIETVFSTIGFY